jgi:hypothetical protein
MFDQLLDWLSRQPAPDGVGFSAKKIGIGATALCLRWGSYLAVLLDERKPPDPHIGTPEISMIADSEMKRINLEFSSNLARLIRMLHENEADGRRLLLQAQQCLPMPRFRFRQCADPFEDLEPLVSHLFWELAGSELRDHLDRARPIVSQHPYRILGNSMALATWRNGPVEDIHCGRTSDYSLDCRRITDEQCSGLMGFTSGRLSVLLSKFRPWKSPGTCSSWSLIESCSVVDLQCR